MLRQHSDNTQYCLSIPKTTIGTTDCELIVQGPEVAPQHLQIEKRSGTEYVLHDLGTSEGTFVNHCRVSGASVKLNCGDVIKLGLNSPTYTFITPQPTQKTSEIVSTNGPSIVGGELRPASAPLSQPDNVTTVSPQRNSSAILTGRQTMKRNVLNGILGNSSRSTSPTSPDKSDLLNKLQQTVIAQENKLASLTEDMRQIKSTERQGSPQAQTISYLERELEELKKGKIHTLKKLEQQKSETHSANHVLASLQGELTNKTEVCMKLERELEQLNKDKKENSGTVVSLRRQLAEREAELRHIKAEFNAYKVRPDEIKEQNIIFAKENKNLRKQVRDSKRQSQDNQDKVNHLEKDLAELQSKLQHETRMHITARDMVSRCQTEVADKVKLERMLKIELKEAEAQLRLFEASVREALSKLEREEQEEEEKGNVDLVKNLNLWVQSHLETKKTLSKREEELVLSKKAYEVVHDNLAKIELESLDLLELVQTESEISEKVEKEGNKIASLDISENLKWLQGMILALARSVQKYSSEVEGKTKLADEAAIATGLEPGTDPTGLGKILEQLKQTAICLRKDRDCLQEKLTNTIDNYEHKLADQHKKLTTNMAQEIQSLKRLNEEHIRAVYVSEQQKLNEMTCEYTTQTNHLKHRLGELQKSADLTKQELDETRGAKHEMEHQIADLENAAKTSKMIEESLRGKIAKFDEDTLSLRQRNLDREETLKALTEETESLREQNRQYAITIVSMENKLHKMSSKCTDIETELNSSLSKLESIPPPPPEPYDVLKDRENGMKREIQRLTTLSNTLRREYGLAKAEADQRAVQIQGLRCDLAGAAARLSDMSGELSESQKIDMENTRDKIREQEAQIKVQKQTIDLLSEEVEKVNKKLANVPDRIPAKKPNKVKIEYREREMTEDEKADVEKGKKCIDERHSIIIDKQRLALAEFREQLRTRAPPPTLEHTDTEHVTRLKKELSELRAALRHKDEAYADKETDLKNKARQLNTCTEKNMDVLKQTKSELNDSQRLLGHSEACFSALVTEMRSVLNQPQTPISALTVNKLEHALKERAMLTADLGAQICAVTTRLSQKDILLSTYQDDLSNLRKSEIDADNATTEVSIMKKKISNLQEESSQLRRSLSHLQGELDQQQRLNNALVQRNAAREVSSEPHLTHQCPDPRREDEMYLLKKQHQEEIKRKNYDIKKLKEVLDAS